MMEDVSVDVFLKQLLSCGGPRPDGFAVRAAGVPGAPPEHLEGGNAASPMGTGPAAAATPTEPSSPSAPSRRPSAPSIVHVQRWTPLEVGAWLQRISLGKFAERFVTQNVGGDVLFDITARDLTDMGVTTVGDRRRLLKALEALREEARAGAQPQLDVAVLGASPLVHVTRLAERTNVLPLDMIDFEREQDLLRTAVRASKKFVPGGLQPFFAIGTFEALSNVLELGAKVLTLTGHTTSEGRILLETETGEAAEIDPSAMLASMLEPDHCRSSPRAMPVCVVLSSCYSRQAALAFLAFGARHIVAVQRDATVLDSAARVFNATFHHALLVGNSVESAFRFAVSQVRHSARIPEAEARKFLLLPDDVPGRHDVALFGCNVSSPLSGPLDIDNDEEWSPSSSQERPEMRVVGRQRDMWQVILALGSSRCVVVCGSGGVGKAALCRGAAAYLEQRGRRFCTNGTHIVCLRGIRTAHAARAQLQNVVQESSKRCAVGGAAGAIEVDNTASLPGERWEQVLGRLGERLLLLVNAEEVLHACPTEMVQLLDGLLAAGPRLRVLLTSRRTVPLQAWQGCGHPPPHHHTLRQLEPGASERLLRQMAPTLRPEVAAQIAGLCGHLPLALKVVGQRLAVASDPLAEANDFVAETTSSPEKRTSMLFSQCVAPYVWRGLDASRRAALAALTLFRGQFDLAAAAAVLGVPAERARPLLADFEDQCLVERPAETGDCYYIPTSVHLVVRQQFTDHGHSSGESISSGSACVSEAATSAAEDGTCAAEIRLEGVNARLVFHFVGLLRNVELAIAEDHGRGSAGLEALTAFDHHRADIDAALALAGNSDLFIVMVQLGREVFETRLCPQRRVEIYERTLGVLMARRKAVAVGTGKPQQSVGNLQQLLRVFEKGVVSMDMKPLANVARSFATPAGTPGNGGCSRAVTVPCTPANQRTTMMDLTEGHESSPSTIGSPEQTREETVYFNDDSQPGLMRRQISEPLDKMLSRQRTHGALLDANGQAFASLVGIVGEIPAGVGHSIMASGSPAPSQAQTLPQSPSPSPSHKMAVSPAVGVPKGPPPTPVPGIPALPGMSPVVATSETDVLGTKTPRPALQRPPSFIFAGPDGSEEVTASAKASAEYGSSGECTDIATDGIATSHPPWCPPLVADQNAQLLPQLASILRSAGPSRSVGVDNSSSGMAGDGLYVTSKWGGCELLWHEEVAQESALVEVLLRLGLAYSSLGRFAHAAQLLRKALLRVEEMTQPGARGGRSAEGMRAELLGTLSTVLCQQGLVQDAEFMLWQARQLAKSSGHTELEVKLTCDIADFTHKFKGNVKAAQRLFKLGLEKRRKTSGDYHLDTADALNKVGVFRAQTGDLHDAKTCIRQAIEIRLKILGFWNLSLAEALHNLANVHESLGNDEEAAKFFENALKIKRRVLPENHVSIADTQNNLSILYSKMKKHDECVGLLRLTLDQCLRTVGENNTSTASVLANLGHALHSLASANRADSSESKYRGQLLESRGFLERALEIKKALFHRQHPSIAQCRANLGYVHFKMNEFDKAERHFNAALRIFRRHYGDTHPDIAKWCYWIANTQLALGRAMESRENYEMALKISSLATPSPFNSDLLADIYRHIEDLRDERGEEEEGGGEPAAAREPAEEPQPTGGCAGGPAAAAPGRELWTRLQCRRPAAMDPLDLDTTPSSPASSRSGEGAGGWGGGAGCEVTPAHVSAGCLQAELGRIMKQVRQSAEEYENTQQDRFCMGQAT